MLPAYAAIHWDILRSTFPKGCQFEIAVQPFIPNDVHTSVEYDERITHYELTQPRNVDFQHRHDRARKEICEWTEQKTHGKIKGVVPMGVIDRDTNIFILVAVYIKVQWQYPFQSSSTNKMPFFLPMKETPNVYMMYQQGTFRWATHSKLDCDILELPFSKCHNKMLIFLPKKQDGISKVDIKLSRAFLDTILESLKYETVDVYLPRFRYELGHTTGDKLQALGMKDMMTAGKAQFPGFEGRLGIHLSRCFHHISFEFEEGVSGEKGGSSAASTSGAELESDPKKIKTFKCDHPFLVIIRDDRTGAILLIGRIVRPTVV
jgi:serpin B